MAYLIPPLSALWIQYDDEGIFVFLRTHRVRREVPVVSQRRGSISINEHQIAVRRQTV
jgi:hypothetical protein